MCSGRVLERGDSCQYEFDYLRGYSRRLRGRLLTDRGCVVGEQAAGLAIDIDRDLTRPDRTRIFRFIFVNSSMSRSVSISHLGVA